jgi:hypothetical protein
VIFRLYFFNLGLYGAARALHRHALINAVAGARNRQTLLAPAGGRPNGKTDRAQQNRK